MDTSGLLALLDAGEAKHELTRRALQQRAERRVTTDWVLAELDYLILHRLGTAAEQRFLALVLQGAVAREPVSDADLRKAQSILTHYADQELGLTDATLLAVGERLEATAIVTLDHRHFAPYRMAGGAAFSLLP